MTRHLFTQNYYILWRLSGPKMKYVSCYLLLLPKESNMTKRERGKILNLKETER